MTTFEQTDISRQLREACVPESAYIYVENLWCRNIEMRQAFKKIDVATSNIVDELEDIMNIASLYSGIFI